MYSRPTNDLLQKREILQWGLSCHFGVFMDIEKVIILSDQRPFAHGNHREVYLHPEKSDRCLKLMTEDWHKCDRWKRANSVARFLRPKWYYHENEGELHFSRVLSRRVGPPAWDFVAHAYEMVDSDLGPVLEVDLITDFDGKVSLSLKEYVWQYGLTPECEAALEEFWQQLDKHWVFVEARPDNLSVQVKADGRCQIFAIDGYAFGQLIPLAKWFRREQKRVFRKRRRKQDCVLNEILGKRESGGSLKSQGIQRKD